MEKIDHVEDSLNWEDNVKINAGEIGCDTVYRINVMQDIN